MSVYWISKLLIKHHIQVKNIQQKSNNEKITRPRFHNLTFASHTRLTSTHEYKQPLFLEPKLDSYNYQNNRKYSNRYPPEILLLEYPYVWAKTVSMDASPHNPAWAKTPIIHNMILIESFILIQKYIFLIIHSKL